MITQRMIDEFHVEAMEYVQTIKEDFMRTLMGNRQPMQPPMPPQGQPMQPPMGPMAGQPMQQPLMQGQPPMQPPMGPTMR